LWWVFGLVVIFMVVEIVVGLISGSLALLSDAGHMATDAVGLGMALAAIVAANRAGLSSGRTFGLYRAEILAALANSVLLFGVAVYVLWEAFGRLSEPTEVLSGPMLAAAVAGLIVNIVGWWLLREGAEESLNVEGAFLEVLADLVGSIGVVVAAVLIAITGWVWIDPVVGAGIGLYILPRAWRLGRRATRILIQAAPEHVDLDSMYSDLAGLEGVTGVHDLHVWTLTSDMLVASAHIASASTTSAVLDAARELIEKEYGISHATLQVETDSEGSCREIAW
jgi:cobalt-zinc-cadmium efflux system protein